MITAPPSPHPVPLFLCYKNVLRAAVSQEVGKLIIVMEMLADVGLGHFVEQARLGWPICEHQEYSGAFCVFLPQPHREFHECSCGCFSTSLRTSSGLCVSNSLNQIDLSNLPRRCCPNRIQTVKHPLPQHPSKALLL